MKDFEFKAKQEYEAALARDLSEEEYAAIEKLATKRIKEDKLRFHDASHCEATNCGYVEENTFGM